MNSAPQFAVEPEVFRFCNEQDLRRQLEEIDKHTVHFDLMSPADIQLDSAGRLRRGGFRLTTLAMAQLCQKLCPGLTKLAFTVSGNLRGPDDKPEYFSIATATKVINDIATLRFGYIDGKQLLRNAKTGIIEGITGAGYYFLSNIHFLEKVIDATQASDHEYIFHDAVMCGRKLTLYYRHKDPLLTIDTDVFYSGFDLTNAETGECAVRISPIVLLIDETTPVCLRSFKAKRLVHSGKKFTNKLDNVLRVALNEDDRHIVENPRLIKGITDLTTCGLGFGNLKEDAHEQRIKLFTEAITNHKLTSSIADHLIKATLYKRTNLNVYKPDFVLNAWAQKTRYDLLLSIMNQASKASFQTKENLEKLGLALILNKLNLPT